MDIGSIWTQAVSGGAAVCEADSKGSLGFFYGRCKMGLQDQEGEAASGFQIQVEQRTREYQKANDQIPRRDGIPDSGWESDLSEVSSP